MDETVQEFTTWLITFVAIYAVVFLFVRHVLRRFVFPNRKSSDEPSGKPPAGSSRESPELRHASHPADAPDSDSKRND